jgi:hypothetical protein
MPVYLPIAEMSVNAGAIILLGIIVGIFSGLFGVGGGFLATPLLMFMGIPPVVAVATQTCQIVASSSAGVVSQWQRKGIDLQLAMHMLAGGAVGTLIGMGIFQLLRLLGQIDLAISLLYTVLLGGIGISMLVAIAGSYFHRASGKPRENRVHAWLKTLPYQTDYAASSIRISRIGPMTIGLLSGILLAIMGTGSGFMVVPAMIYFLGMPALMVTGTSMLQLACLAFFTGLMHAVTSQSIDLMLAALLIFGSVIGTILGLRASKYIRGMPARLLLAVMILGVCLCMAYRLVVPPANPYSITVERQR